jgi:Arm DNA-binding domain
VPAIRLTKRAVDSAQPESRTFVLYDDSLTGFGLRITPAGSKSFIVEYRPNGGGRRSPTRRMTLGASTALTADQARRAAREIIAAARLGQDPAAERTKIRRTPTVREFLEKYLEEEASSKLKPRTLVNLLL